MSTDKERIFVVGATGKTGSAVVDELIKKGACVTVYVRSPQKLQHADKVTIVQGDFNDLAPLRQSVTGHTRLCLVTSNSPAAYKIEISISEIAYAAGVKQIVHLSGIRLPWRSWDIVQTHEKAEKAIFDIPGRGAFVSLQPTNFMSNQLMTLDTIKNDNVIIDSADPNEPQEWISPNDDA